MINLNPDAIAYDKSKSVGEIKSPIEQALFELSNLNKTLEDRIFALAKQVTPITHPTKSIFNLKVESCNEKDCNAPSSLILSLIRHEIEQVSNMMDTVAVISDSLDV